jgi:anthranilate synthase component I
MLDRIAAADSLRTFRELASRGNVIALTRRLMSDQLTPVLGYRRLVAPDERTAPSFLFESVENGTSVGRYSFIGAQPSMEVLARGHEVMVIDHRGGGIHSSRETDPLEVPKRLTAAWRVVRVPSHPLRFTGGWVGYAGYDSVRYLEAEKLPFESAPPDDRDLPDMHFGLYRQVGVFDHVEKVLHAVSHVVLDEHPSVEAAYRHGHDELESFVDRLETHAAIPLPPGSVDLDLARLPRAAMAANFTRDGFEDAVRRCKEYIAAGDAFQVVLSQRFERRTTADPFEIYRALRIVNPSPYMIYLQASGSILVASSPEILCRCSDGIVTNRPLAGTRRRGKTPEEDAALEQELHADAKERAEHVMLVDLGRNDLGRVCETGSIRLEKVMDIERYSHVMHLSSTLTGRLRRGLDCWDALRNTLPVGTVSGAPKVRAMQIIDELEPTRRGPYAGGIGVVGFGFDSEGNSGDMDIALALRTMVIPTGQTHKHTNAQTDKADSCCDGAGGPLWTVHLQAGAGIVADSVPSAEYEETVNKAAALGRAIDLAESAFSPRDSQS